jgi:DNA polymerase I
MNLHLITDINDLGNLQKKLCEAQTFAYDTETTGLDWWCKRIFSLSFCIDQDVWLIYVNDFIHPIDGSYSILSNFLGAIFEDEEKECFGHNIKFDRLHTMETFHVWIDRQCHDTLLMAHLCDENRKNGLKPLMESVLKMPITDESNVKAWLKDHFSKEADWDYSAVPREIMTPYASMDTYCTWKLREKLWPIIQQHFASLYETDRKVLDILTRMEYRGLLLDIPYLQELQPKYEQVILESQQNVFKSTGFEFNIGSDIELAEVLYSKLGLPCQKFTPKGQMSTDMEAINELQHPCVEHLLKWSEYSHSLNNFIKPLQELADDNHRVHGSFSLTSTRTGRFACSHPNLQNMPKNDDIRRGFIVDPGRTMWFWDHSQIEMVGFTMYSKDPKMTLALKTGVDLHRTVASEVLEMDPEKIDKAMRAMGKGTNFAIIFGVGKAKLARYINGYMPPERKLNNQEAFEFKQKYFIKFPSVKEFQYSVMNTVRATREPWGNFVKNKFGRVRRIKPEKAYTGVNHLIQGWAADLMKASMVRIDEKFPGTDWRQNIHDAIRIDNNIPFQQQLEWAQEIGYCLTDWPEVPVPISCTVDYSNTNWTELKSVPFTKKAEHSDKQIGWVKT